MIKKGFLIIKNNIFMLSYIKRYCPYHIFSTLLASILTCLSSIANLFIVRYIINSLQTQRDKKILFYTVCMAILLLFINILCAYISSYIQQIVIPRNTKIISSKMQAEIFKKATMIEMKYYDDPSFFNIYSMALQQSDTRAQYVLDTLDTLIANLFCIGALVALISLLQPILFIFVFFNIVFTFLINNIIAKLEYSFTQESVQPQRELEYSNYIFYRMENAKELRVYKNLYTIIINIIFDASKKIINLTNKYGKKLLNCFFLQSLVSNLMNTVIIIYLACKVFDNKLLIGDFVTLSSSSQQLSIQISSIINSFSQMYKHSLYIGKFKEFIKLKIPKNYNEGFSIERINSIKFENVFFKYPFSQKYSLENLNFEMNSGEIIAIVGDNGAGKTTLTKLLIGLYEVDRGQILLNGKNIKTCKLCDLRNHISIVFQDYKVYSLSIAENILMNYSGEDKKEKKEEVVIEALKYVGLYDRVSQLPAGINSKITREFNDDGVMFSGGEMQKIALARAYASNSSLLIFDEPSSSLDPLSEYDMLYKMMEISKGKCAIIISHRLNNIKNVSRIYVLHKGKIVESGTHEQLLKRRGMYYTMYNKQTREIENIL